MLLFFDKWTAASPQPFGLFHFLILGIIIIGIVLICVFLRHTSDKTTRIILLSIGGIMILLEIVRQIINITTPGGFFWQWFPFQLCSVVMYFYITAGLLKKDSWLKEAVLLFLASYGLFGGLLTMIMPSIVWNTDLGAVIMQTTIHHILMIWGAVYLLVGRKINFKRINFNFLTKAFPIFVATIIIAILINCIVVWSVGVENSHYINMFFVNPYIPAAFDMPLFGDMGLHYLAWFAIFVFGYSLLCFGVLWAVYGIQLLSRKLAAKRIAHD